MKNNEDVSLTDISLLMRICCNDRDESAWREFVERYGYRIYAWCAKRNLQPTDSEDVTQEVLLKLARKLGTFEYDRKQSFRGWLRSVTNNAVTDFFRERREVTGGSAISQQLSFLEAREELVATLSEAFDLEVLEEAVRRVKSRVSPERFLVWHRMARDGASGAEVAQELNMKIVSVYTARSQIQRLLRDEINLLERHGLEPSVSNEKVK